MQVRLTREYRCAPEGHTVQAFPAGLIVSGQVAEWALADGAGERADGPVAETKVVHPPEVKAGKPEAGVLEAGNSPEPKRRARK